MLLFIFSAPGAAIFCIPLYGTSAAVRVDCCTAPAYPTIRPSPPRPATPAMCGITRLAPRPRITVAALLTAFPHARLPAAGDDDKWDNKWDDDKWDHKWGHKDDDHKKEQKVGAGGWMDKLRDHRLAPCHASCGRCGEAPVDGTFAAAWHGSLLLCRVQHASRVQASRTCTASSSVAPAARSHGPLASSDPPRHILLAACPPHCAEARA